MMTSRVESYDSASTTFGSHDGNDGRKHRRARRARSVGYELTPGQLVVFCAPAVFVVHRHSVLAISHQLSALAHRRSDSRLRQYH